jgi:hypothetical protein
LLRIFFWKILLDSKIYIYIFYDIVIVSYFIAIFEGGKRALLSILRIRHLHFFLYLFVFFFSILHTFFFNGARGRKTMVKARACCSDRDTDLRLSVISSWQQQQPSPPPHLFFAALVAPVAAEAPPRTRGAGGGAGGGGGVLLLLLLATTTWNVGVVVVVRGAI